MSVYYRKAIAKSGLQHLSTQPCASALAKCDLDREIRSTVDWSVSTGWTYLFFISLVRPYYSYYERIDVMSHLNNHFITGSLLFTHIHSYRMLEAIFRPFL